MRKLEIEEALPERGRVMLTIDEDLDCSGLTKLDCETDIYDDCLVSALFKRFTPESSWAKEINCWCTGARTCRFLVTQVKKSFCLIIHYD